jgi:hypothetical protein
MRASHGGAASLDVEGFCLRAHASRCATFRDPGEIERVHVEEIRQLLLEASAPIMSRERRGVLRFGERSPDSGALNNFAARALRARRRQRYDRGADSMSAARPDNGRAARRSAHTTCGASLTPPPQDVPLAVCDARSVRPGN